LRAPRENGDHEVYLDATVLKAPPVYRLSSDSPLGGERGAKQMIMTTENNTAKHRINLPKPVADIYRAVAELERLYPGRKFTLDGHLVGSIGEVIAAEHFGLTLYGMSKTGHDAFDANGDIQIKLTAGKAISMYSDCVRLIVLRIVSPENVEAEIVYDGPGAPAWAAAGPKQKNGQRTIGLTKLQAIACLGKAVVMAHNLELVEAMRARFRPDKIVTLFVGESAPDSDKFFYFGKNDMLTYTRQAIEQALGGGGGDDILDRFKALGWYLDDLSLVPVNNLGSKAIRRSMCRAARQSLAERIAAYQPQAIVTVVSSIKNDVAAAAIAAGCDAPRYVLPFAGQGHQTKYMRQLAEIIPRLPRLSGGE
jgi:hypothetical protein